jgi:hypothetical protein
MEHDGEEVFEVMVHLRTGEKMKRCDITPGCFLYNWTSL